MPGVGIFANSVVVREQAYQLQATHWVRTLVAIAGLSAVKMRRGFLKLNPEARQLVMDELEAAIEPVELLCPQLTAKVREGIQNAVSKVRVGIEAALIYAALLKSVTRC